MTSLARRTDPASSHLAAAEVVRSGVRGEQQRGVLTAVWRWDGRTSAELARLAGMDRYAAARRLPELENRGLLRKGPIRPCAVTRRPSVTWFLVEAPPEQQRLI